jgi:PAS domain-containing protein
MVLDRQLRFVAANDEYLQVTGKRLEELLGQDLFEAFPHDPADPGNESAALLRQSLERVLATGKPDVIAFIRYRVPRAQDGDGEVEDRFWSAYRARRTIHPLVRGPIRLSYRGPGAAAGTHHEARRTLMPANF